MSEEKSIPQEQPQKPEGLNEYINYNIRQSISDFTKEEEEKIIKCIHEISKKMVNIQFDYFNGRKANTIAWKIGCIKGKLYENGLPHTRLDVIILPKEIIQNSSMDNLQQYLLHEKIHVYQKLYPKDVQLYLKKNHFVKIDKKTDLDHFNNRANPDMDEWIYKDDSQIYQAVYNNYPTSISDVHFSGGSNKLEHPFEKMAYDIDVLAKTIDIHHNSKINK